MPGPLNSHVPILALVLAVAIAVLSLTGAVLLIGGQIVQQVPAPVTKWSLARSVSVAADSAFISSGECKRARDGWSCDVVDSGGSGYYGYKVEVDADSSCWRATLVNDGGEIPAPKELNGCVRRFEGGWVGKLFG